MAMRLMAASGASLGGLSGNPGGRPAQGSDRRKIEADARLLARSHGVGAVENLVAIMNYQPVGRDDPRHVGGRTVRSQSAPAASTVMRVP